MTSRCKWYQPQSLLALSAGAVNDKHRGGAPTFIRRAQMCFHSQCDLWDNWAGVCWEKTASVEEMAKMDDSSPAALLLLSEQS